MSSTYQVGDKTKEKILKVSRELFYEKGFEETTYDDISKKAEINRALIPYHFKNKKNLGAVIHDEFLNAVAELRNKITTNSSDTVATAVNTFVYYYCLKNRNAVRFMYQMQKEQSFRDRFVISEKVFIKGLTGDKQNVSSQTLDILARMDYGIEREIVEMMYTDDIGDRLDEVVSMEINIMLRYLGYAKKEVQNILDEALNIIKDYDIRVKDKFKLEIARKN